jgi:glycosyltransferase involved in cell wall biosynthesis
VEEAVVISGISDLALYINTRLNTMGFRSKLVTVGYQGQDPSVVNLTIIYYWLDFLLQRFRSFVFRYIILNVDKKYHYYQDINEDKHYFPVRTLLNKIGKPKCIFILFNYRLLTSNSIRIIWEKTNATIFLLMPDMALITGGCSYSWDCKHYQNGCGNCPAIQNFSRKKLASETLYKKIKNLNGIKLLPLVFSSEQKAQAEGSLLFKSQNAIKCFFPIDEHIFKPGDMSRERSYLKLPQDAKIILFGAQNVFDKRKGFVELKDAIKMLIKMKRIQKLHLIVAGRTGKSLDDISSLVPTTEVGLLNHEMLSRIYRAANLFVCPSLADSGPTMVNQSLLCGTPVVAFDVGVAIDLIKNGETGYLVKDRSSSGLAAGINNFFRQSQSDQKEFRKNCIKARRHMIEFGFFNVIKNYIKQQ